MMIVVGVDVGGTFTDIIAVNTRTGRQVVHKVPSTPNEQDRAVIKGLMEILKSERIDGSEVEMVVHGTTVATNALIQRKGAEVCLITTRGLEDIIEIGRQNRLDIYDLTAQRPEPLVRRNHRIGVRERVDYQGNIIEDIEETEIARAAERIERINPDSVAVSLLYSFKNPKHEQLLKQALEKLGKYYVVISSEVLPEFREYERTSTTVLEAYLGPLMTEYLSRLERSVSEILPKSKVTVMQSNGGTMLASKAKGHVISLAVSGLAGGVIGAWTIANARGLKNVITLDMGGTSCDISSIMERIVIKPDNEVEGQPLRAPSIDVTTIGAGGGSIAWIDDMNVLHVGPQSAGAVPGPASYDLGGMDATVTDANLIIGRINPNYFLGGKKRIEMRLARKAIGRIAEHLGMTVEEAALGIIRISTSNMVEAIRDVTIERGHDPRDFVLVAFGGAGPTQAVDIAEMLEIDSILIPPYPGITSAFGLLCADLRTDLVQTVLFEELEDDNRLRSVFEELSMQAKERLVEQGAREDEVHFEWSMDMRYKGQSHELEIEVAQDSENLFRTTKADFERVHESRFGYSLPEREVEWVSARVAAISEQQSLIKKPVISINHGTPIEERTTIIENAESVLAQVYRREMLGINQEVQGPAIIEQVDTTIYIAKNWTGIQQEDGTLLLRREKND